MLLDHFDVKTGSRKIADMTPVRIAALPAELQPHVKKLRAHYDDTMLKMKAGQPGPGEYGVLAVLGPGFSCELALIRGQ